MRLAAIRPVAQDVLRPISVVDVLQRDRIANEEIGTFTLVWQHQTLLDVSPPDLEMAKPSLQTGRRRRNLSLQLACEGRKLLFRSTGYRGNDASPTLHIEKCNHVMHRNVYAHNISNALHVVITQPQVQRSKT